MRSIRTISGTLSSARSRTTANSSKSSTRVVAAFLAADAKLPKDAALPRPAARTVARYLADRRDYPVLDVIDALGTLAQPELLETVSSNAEVELSGGHSATVETSSVLAPIAITTR